MCCIWKRIDFSLIEELGVRKGILSYINENCFREIGVNVAEMKSFLKYWKWVVRFILRMRRDNSRWKDIYFRLNIGRTSFFECRRSCWKKKWIAWHRRMSFRTCDPPQFPCKIYEVFHKLGFSYLTLEDEWVVFISYSPCQKMCRESFSLQHQTQIEPQIHK